MLTLLDTTVVFAFVCIVVVFLGICVAANNMSGYDEIRSLEAEARSNVRRFRNAFLAATLFFALTTVYIPEGKIRSSKGAVYEVSNLIPVNVVWRWDQRFNK